MHRAAANSMSAIMREVANTGGTGARPFMSSALARSCSPTMMEIVPVLDTKFTKKSELSVFLLIYNPKVDSNNKPDVMVEYNFCQAAAGGEPKAGEPCKAGEKFFNKTNPQNLNASTLPPQFDMAAGHQLQSGQAVSLAPFPEGQYRLEIKVTDKVANKSLTRDVNFSVNPS